MQMICFPLAFIIISNAAAMLSKCVIHVLKIKVAGATPSMDLFVLDIR